MTEFIHGLYFMALGGVLYCVAWFNMDYRRHKKHMSAEEREAFDNKEKEDMQQW
jgi:cbb3-type cytochrome oxidase subunit 3